MHIPLYYRKLLFVAFGLLFAITADSQDTLTTEGGDCETFKKMEKNNIYKNNKIYSGYYIKCTKQNKVINVQQFENGKFQKYVELTEVDSVLNIHAVLSWKKYYRNKNNVQYSEDGIYKNGLFTGKKYIYDENGLLEKIEIWKNGKYAGDAQIE